ncbi:spore photoproduct lyase family protein [Roseisolibacter sp. H3M3-2]|uniref:spore photoproduct lyase family protein n=1 Tax=Roseisolibacter sp. H3M3-2 TaxID=3031323 RepID=UPI0023DADE94|nr:spore photoproduct lyase family protein [Roseisolibacter sp. H3M3-2]MDF1503820.1 spore photoproduct lyase family protein [Roseisolibacter sp. H3M3-2]
MPPLLRVRTIYHEPAVPEFARGREILARFPDAERIEVASHWRIPELHGDAARVKDWVRVKRDVLVLGVRKTMDFRPNGRSADFIAPAAANGCAMACAYCYVPRRKGFANPITTFVNIERILDAVTRHAARQGPKTVPDQVDPARWVYDVGENGDCSVDATISDNVRDLVARFRALPNAKASFATKYVNEELLAYEPRGATRVRMSLMPAAVARTVDVRTTPIARRLAFVNELVRAGYETHVNLSPVIAYDGWLDDWAELCGQIDDALSDAAKAQLAAEVIFLTHNQQLHEVNLGWHPAAEALLWTPDWQETKRSEQGGVNVRYRTGLKGQLVRQLLDLLAERLPYLRIRYAF